MRSIFLPCKKHVEDDISRKLSDLGSGAMKDEVLKDIFGDEKNKEKGIVDRMSQDEFLAKVLAVTEKWDVLEKSNHPDKELTFSEYFRSNIEEDMKNGMLLPVRRKVKLDDVCISLAVRTLWPSLQYLLIAPFKGHRILSHTSFPDCGSEKSYL